MEREQIREYRYEIWWSLSCVPETLITVEPVLIRWKTMQAGSRLHRKIQKKMGSTYHAEVPLNIIIEEKNYDLESGDGQTAL